MKIVFHRYGSIVEPDVIEAFRQFNIEVIEEKLEVTQKAIDSDTRISVLANEILTHNPEFVFSINYFPYISQICDKLNVKYVALSVDCPVLEIYSSTIRNSCNRVFLFDYAQYESVKDENPSGIFYLPLGTNVQRWDEVLADCKEGYDYDVSFVGSLYNEKSPLKDMNPNALIKGYIDGLINSQLTMPGMSLINEVFDRNLINVGNSNLVEELKRVAPDFYDRYSLNDPIIDTDRYVTLMNVLGFEISALDRLNLLNYLSDNNIDVHVFTRSDTSKLNANIHTHEGVSTHNEMPKVFRRSKINLNPTMRPIMTGLSQRVWDILGCGGFVLSNYQSEIPQYLSIGEDIACYESNEECSELIHYYLSHEDERRQIAKNGYEKVKSMNAYVIRIAKMLKEVIGE